MKRAVALAFLLVALVSPTSADEPAVRAWESPLRVPTYPVGPAEPNPMFYAGREYQGAQGPVYPYPLLDRLLDQREDRAYRALWLENEYLKISVLPEIGGRIFSAQDKTDGYDFFYRQRVIKPALIGMLGAWISGGVEWNVFHHHRATSFMPVQSAITENADGSRTVFVGETEWRQRMRWVVGLTVRPGRSYVEATVRMTNRTPLVHSMLYFSNPAVHTNESYQVIFPPDVDWATFHAKTDFAPWPFARGPFVGRDFAPGTDLSLWKNHPYPISFFVYRSGSDFLAGYDHGRRAGVVHVADRDTMPGKKFCDLGQRARRAHVGQDPHRRGRALHRAHDRRLLRQPARLLVDPAGRVADRRPLLVPGARSGRREGRQPRGCHQPRREGRQGPARRQHDLEAARRAGAPPRRRPGRLRDDGHDRPRRAVRARGGPPGRHPGGRPAPRRPFGGGERARRIRRPPPAEDGRAEALRAPAASRAAHDRGGAVLRGPAPRAVPQPVPRPGGLLPRGAAPRPGRRPHEHGPRHARPAPRPLRRGRETSHDRGRALGREPHPRENRRGAVRAGSRPRGPREDGRRARGLRRGGLGPRVHRRCRASRRHGSSRRGATPPAPFSCSTARSAPTPATPPPSP